MKNLFVSVSDYLNDGNVLEIGTILYSSSGEPLKVYDGSEIDSSIQNIPTNIVYIQVPAIEVYKLWQKTPPKQSGWYLAKVNNGEKTPLMYNHHNKFWVDFCGKTYKPDTVVWLNSFDYERTVNFI